MNEESSVNIRYKDRLFNFIFGREENREWTLSLYNAVNGSNYTDASAIRFNTLGDVLYLGMRNDTSFIVSGMLNVYEHQSTYNRNMPLRLLEYVSDIYSGYITLHKLNKYGSKLIMLPVPKLVVFYNGKEDAEDEVILRLSDSFDEALRNEADVEVRVRMLNINFGHNRQIMEACKPLQEYAWFIEKIRGNQEPHGIDTAVDMAINDMPDGFFIKEFLLMHRAEVKGMLDREYNEAEVMELFKEEGREEERANTMKEKLRADSAEQRADRAEKLLREHGIAFKT